MNKLKKQRQNKMIDNRDFFHQNLIENHFSDEVMRKRIEICCQSELFRKNMKV